MILDSNVGFQVQGLLISVKLFVSIQELFINSIKKRKNFHNDIRKSEFICPLVSMFTINIVVAFIEIAPSSSTVEGHV